MAEDRGIGLVGALFQDKTITVRDGVLVPLARVIVVLSALSTTMGAPVAHVISPD